MTLRRTVRTAPAVIVVMLALIGTSMFSLAKIHELSQSLRSFGTDPVSRSAGPSTRPAGHPSLRADIDGLLAKVRTVPQRPWVPGYDRDCGPGDGCVFGPSWSDDSTAPDGHNGCDTRNDVLGETLADVRFAPQTHGCKVVAGHFVDPYRGRPMDYATEGRQIQIDHLFPLAAAWDLGASRWTLARRMQFANDTQLELLAVDGGANESKGDDTPGSWLPRTSYQCTYVEMYLKVARAYGLALTSADVATIRRVGRTC